MYVGASAPPAPGLSSTTNFLPSVFVAASPIARNVTLLLLPGEYACRSVMFFSGKVWAHVAIVAHNRNSAHGKRPAHTFTCNIDTPPRDGDCAAASVFTAGNWVLAPAAATHGQPTSEFYNQSPAHAPRNGGVVL